MPRQHMQANDCDRDRDERAERYDRLEAWAATRTPTEIDALEIELEVEVRRHRDGRTLVH